MISLRVSLLSLLFLGSCTGEDLASMRAERVHVDLLTAEEMCTVAEQHPTRPVHERLFRSASGPEDLLPGLEMGPPARVQYRIPTMPPGAVLELAACADRNSWDRPGIVHLRASLDGESLIDTQLTTAALLEAAPRLLRIPIENGGLLELTSECEGAGDNLPVVGFTGLSIRVPFERARSLPTPELPNVVLILVDTLRADRLHTYGNPVDVSPHIDALAARGTLFEEAYSDSSWTIPSTVSVLTGLPSISHGVRGQLTQFMSEDLVSIAERFIDHGVDTAAFSCNPLVASGVNFDQGFQEYRVYHWKSAAEIQGDLLAWLAARDGGRFFLYVHLVDPHDPYDPDPVQRERLAAHVPTDWKEESQLDIATRLQEEPSAAEGVLAEAVSFNLALYDAEIASLDAALEPLFSALDERELMDRTVIALTSDHGEEFLEHGFVGHSMQVHEECVHVPLILAGPGVPAGWRESGRVSNVDLGATLLRLAHIDRGSFQGFGDLLEPASSGSAVHFDTVRGIVYEPHENRWLSVGELFGMRAAHWQLHWSARSPAKGGEIVRLWDLTSDPAATRDVAAEHPDVVDQLRGELTRWIREAKARSSATLSDGEAEAVRLREAGYAGGGDDFDDGGNP